MADECYWAKIPLIFKQEVVKQLNLKDRCSLQLVSKTDRELVKSVPISLEDIGFSGCNLPKTSLACMEHPRIINDIVHLKNYHAEGETRDKVKNFLSIFENPKSTVDLVYFDFKEGIDESREFFSILDKEFQNRQKNYKIKTKKLIWGCEEKTEYFLGILNRLDEKTLKGVQLDCPMTLEYLQKVVRDQKIQNLNSFALGSNCKCTLPLTSLLFANYISFVVREISLEDILSVIKNFVSTPRPIGSCFKFYNYEPYFELIDIEKVAKFLDEHFENQAKSEKMVSNEIRFFNMKAASCLLKVDVTSQLICGTVVRKNGEQ